jgi:hypothetical protein
MAANIPGGIGTTEGQNNQTTYLNNLGAVQVTGTAPSSLTGVLPGSTSNVTNWVPDAIQIIQEASEMASVDFTTSYSLRSAKRSLDFLSMEWANLGLNLWTLVWEFQILTPGFAGPYQLPVDTIDLVAPSIRTFHHPRYTVGGTNGNPPSVQTVDQEHCTDIILARMDFASYQSIPDKGAEGRPITVYTQRLQPNPQVYFWLSPSDRPGHDIYTFVYFKLRRMQNVGNATNILDIPFSFVPCMVKGLAHQLALKASAKNFNLIQLLKGEYIESRTMALRENRDRSSVYLTPGGYENETYGGYGTSAL